MTTRMLFWHGSAVDFQRVCPLKSRDELRRVVNERDRLEEILKGPAAGQVNAHATSGLTDACTDFEQLRAQSFDLGRSQGRRQLQAKKVDEVVGETVEQQPEGIGPEAMTAQSVGSEAILELFDAVLTFPAIVIEGKHRMAAAFQVGHEKSQVGSRFGMFSLVADPPLMRPALGTMKKAGKRTLGSMGSTITSSQSTLETIGAALEERVRGHANGVLDAEKLAELIEQRESKARIGAQFDPDFGKRFLEPRNQTQ